MALKKLKMAAILFCILFSVLFLGLAIFYYWASSGILPPEKLSQIIEFPGPLEQPSEHKDVFSVMTYNIGYLSGMLNNLPIKTTKEHFEKNMQTAIQLLQSLEPDFITFQEIDFQSRRSFYVDQLRTIAEKAGYKYAAVAVNWDKHYVPFPYWPPSAHFGKMLSGQAVLSRWPILSAQRVALEKPGGRPFYYKALYLDRLIQAVKIQIKEREIIILNVHLEAFDRETRERQAVKVLDMYRSFKDDYPVLVIGDFNCVPPDATQKNNFIDEPDIDFTNDNTIELFLAEKSLSAAEPVTFTFPSDSPTRKLDHIFYNHDKITLVKSWVATGIACSDHLPLIIQFSLKL
jgi:endonuclease/exonuclease/phosphatase family metal-dependent hydrolase